MGLAIRKGWVERESQRKKKAKRLAAQSSSAPLDFKEETLLYTL